MATAAEFLDKLPQFADVDTAVIDSWLTTASRTVTDEWGTDQDDAQIYLAAHLMSMAGIGPEKGAAALGGIKSINSGGLSFTKDDRMGDYGLTSFGRLFYPTLAGYRGGITVTGTGELPCGQESIYDNAR